MEVGTRALLRTLAAAGRQVGSSNDLQDRGGAAEATAMRERAWQTIADALAAASPDDRERIECLFGPDPLRCFNQILWGQSEDYIQGLLARDPELAVAALRERQLRFQARIGELRERHDALEAGLRVCYTWPTSPSLLALFRQLVGRNGDPPGWYPVGEVSYHLNLTGEGLAHEHRVRQPERCDALVDETWIHVTLDREAARSGVAVTLRSLDGAALARAQAVLRPALAAAGWEELA